MLDIFRVKDGKIVEHWDVIQDVLEQSANGKQHVLRKPYTYGAYGAAAGTPQQILRFCPPGTAPLPLQQTPSRQKPLAAGEMPDNDRESRSAGP